MSGRPASRAVADLAAAPPNPEERAILDAVEARRPAMIEQVCAWSRLNSGSRNLPGLARMAAELQAAFGALGPVRLRDPDPVEAIGADGRAAPVPHGRNLHLSVRPAAPRRVLLTGHMDTVFAEDHPFQQPRWLDQQTLNGPGVADMKGGLSVMLAALTAFEASPWAQAIGYEVVVNSDEEVSSPGSASLLCAAAGRCHVGLTFEPARPDGALVGARKGSGNFSVVLRGRAAHAGRDPDAGRNAVVAAADLVVRLSRLRIEGVGVNPARIDGGGPPNIVPELAVIRLNLRVASRAAQDEAELALSDLVARIAAEHEVSAQLHGHVSRPPKPLDARQLELFEFVRACGAAIGLPLAWRDSGGVCDGNNLAAAGLPVVDTLGVVGGAIHSDAEFLHAPSLGERARLAALTLMRLARLEPGFDLCPDPPEGSGRSSAASQRTPP